MKAAMPLPKDIEYIISRLCSNGFRADVVGGCVRDFLLGKLPSDYDLTTSATPDEMRAVFSDVRTLDMGIKHGTLTLIVGKSQYEITTYRFDGEYTDNRHPDRVTFTRSLADDLARRDFTVNAMCYNGEDGYTDLFDGMGDLEKRIIRAVGDAEKRFTEDALRILRALRFSATLDFEIEQSTSLAIHKTAHLLKKVSKERIFTEWNKLLSGVGAYRIIKEYGDVIGIFIPELNNAVLPNERKFTLSTPEIRELSLFAGAFEKQAGDSYLSAMSRLKSDNKRKTLGFAALEYYSEKTDTDTDLKRLLIKVGKDESVAILKLKILLGLSEETELTRLLALLDGGVCYRIADLRINGNDLAEIGIRGKRTGEVLKRLLLLTADGSVENERKSLLKEVAKMT